VRVAGPVSLFFGFAAYALACSGAYEESPTTAPPSGSTDAGNDAREDGDRGDRDAGGERVDSGDGADGGGDAASGLTCKTYSECPGESPCCYTPDAGTSICRSACFPSDREICTIDEDNCGGGRSCEPFAGAPGPQIGECIGD
jgi:hypothetical protein